MVSLRLQPRYDSPCVSLGLVDDGRLDSVDGFGCCGGGDDGPDDALECITYLRSVVGMDCVSVEPRASE